MEQPATALFVRSASPGAVLRFLERRNDPSKPAEVLISEGYGDPQWRALFGPAGYLLALTGPLSTSFPPEAHFAIRTGNILTITTYKDGEPTNQMSSTSNVPMGLSALFRFNTMATPDPVYIWAKEQGLPTRYLKEPPKKIIDYSTVAILDQRKLLVEDSPRLYRFPLGGPVGKSSEG